jgi:hypothetical protein
MGNLKLGISYYTYWRHLISCNFGPRNAMWHDWWHGKMAPNGKTITCVWIATKSCINCLLMIIIYYFDMIFSMIVCFKSHNKFVLQATSMFKFNLNFILFFLNWIPPSKITCYEQILMLTHLLNHNLMQRMWFWVLFH